MHQDPIDALPAGQRERRTWYAGCVPPEAGRRTGGCLSQARLDSRAGTFTLGGSMSIVAWIVLGLIAGAIAKALMPGNDPGGFIVTILIGIVGAFLGGFLGNLIADRGLSGFSVWSIVLAIVGAMLLLWIYRMAVRRTP